LKKAKGKPETDFGSAAFFASEEPERFEPFSSINITFTS